MGAGIKASSFVLGEPELALCHTSEQRGFIMWFTSKGCFETLHEVYFVHTPMKKGGIPVHRTRLEPSVPKLRQPGLKTGQPLVFLLFQGHLHKRQKRQLLPEVCSPGAQGHPRLGFKFFLLVWVSGNFRIHAKGLHKTLRRKKVQR